MVILIHGGAGFKKPIKSALRKLCESLSAGFNILSDGGSALDAVVISIKILEDSGIFNAGIGGNLQLDGVRRLDASVMEGKHLRAGSVISLEGIRNPVETAKYVMETSHVLLTNIGAQRIALSKKLAPLPEPDKKLKEKLKMIKKQKKEVVEIYNRYFSTVGAVALDAKGNVAAGASTGGISAMLPGRVGDSPVIGSGIYADNRLGAVSCTGIGEYIIRLALAKEICMNLKTSSLYIASKMSLNRIKKLGGEAGILLINKKGQFTIMHTTKYMPSGYASSKGLVVREGFRRIF